MAERVWAGAEGGVSRCNCILSAQCGTPRNQIQETAFLQQIVLKKRFLVFDFAVYCPGAVVPLQYQSLKPPGEAAGEVGWGRGQSPVEDEGKTLSAQTQCRESNGCTSG
eukprot:360240-Rhodomonas_salina.2